MINILNNHYKFKEKYICLKNDTTASDKELINFNKVLKERTNNLYKFSYDLNKISKTKPALFIKGLPYFLKGISIIETDKLLKNSTLSRKGLIFLNKVSKNYNSFLYSFSVPAYPAGIHDYPAGSLPAHQSVPASQLIKWEGGEYECMYGRVDEKTEGLGNIGSDLDFPFNLNPLDKASIEVEKNKHSDLSSNFEIIKNNEVTCSTFSNKNIGGYGGLLNDLKKVQPSKLHFLEIQSIKKGVDRPRSFISNAICSSRISDIRKPTLDKKINSNLSLKLDGISGNKFINPLNTDLTQKDKSSIYFKANKLNSSSFDSNNSQESLRGGPLKFRTNKKIYKNNGLNYSVSAADETGSHINSKEKLTKNPNLYLTRFRGSIDWVENSKKGKRFQRRNETQYNSLALFKFNKGTERERILRNWKISWEKKKKYYEKLSNYTLDTLDLTLFNNINEIRKIIHSKYTFDTFLSSSQSINFSFNKNTKKINFSSIYKLLKYFYSSLSALISKPVYIVSPNKIYLRLFFFILPKKIILHKERKVKYLTRKQGLTNQKDTDLLNKIMTKFKIKEFLARWKESNTLVQIPSLPDNLPNILPSLFTSDYLNQARGTDNSTREEKLNSIKDIEQKRFNIKITNSDNPNSSANNHLKELSPEYLEALEIKCLNLGVLNSSPSRAPKSIFNLNYDFLKEENLPQFSETTLESATTSLSTNNNNSSLSTERKGLDSEQLSSLTPSNLINKDNNYLSSFADKPVTSLLSKFTGKDKIIANLNKFENVNSSTLTPIEREMSLPLSFDSGKKLDTDKGGLPDLFNNSDLLNVTNLGELSTKPSLIKLVDNDIFKDGFNRLQLLKLRDISTITSANEKLSQFLVSFLENLFKKEVELEIIRIKYPYHDSNILSQILENSSYRTTFRNMMKRLFYTATIKNPTNMISKQDFSILPSFLSGVKVKLAGRIANQKVVPKFTVQSFQMGSLARGKISFVNTSRITHKNKRGAYSFTVSTSHFLENKNPKFH